MLRASIQGFFAVLFVLALSVLSVRAQQNAKASRSNSGGNAGSTAPAPAPDDKPRNVGSPYVELDSWIYPAIERIAALGYIRDEFLGMRPWTRLECARLVQRAEAEINSGGSAPSEANQFQTELKKEFQTELDALAGAKERSIRLESVYATSWGSVVHR